jgi:hypothetical protein
MASKHEGPQSSIITALNTTIGVYGAGGPTDLYPQPTEGKLHGREVDCAVVVIDDRDLDRKKMNKMKKIYPSSQLVGVTALDGIAGVFSKDLPPKGEDELPFREVVIGNPDIVLEIARQSQNDRPLVYRVLDQLLARAGVTR